jgi:diacylglycerol kinase family enzyme
VARSSNAAERIHRRTAATDGVRHLPGTIAIVREGVLIVNPFATAVNEPRLRAVEGALRQAVELRTVLTDRSGHATELAREACEHADVLFVFAGDGTFNEAINGLDGVHPIGFVPGGGSSVLPRALGIAPKPVAAAEQLVAALLEGRARRISVGRVNGRRFGFSAGLGIDAELVRRMDAFGRTEDGRRPGDLRFAWTLISYVAEQRARMSPALEVSGLGRAAFALVANGDPYTYVGPIPLRVAPDARFELGLDVVGARELRPGALPRFLTYVLAGRGQQKAKDVLYGHDLDTFEVVCDAPTPLQVDGEDLGDVERAVFECERDAISVLV